MFKGYVDLSRGQLHYYQEGEGEPLVLLHQAPLSAVEWLDVMPFLSQKYRVIALDLPGHGNSYDLPGAYEVEDFAAVIVEFMDAMGIKRANLGGNHSGSAISLCVALTSPNRVKRLILSGETLTTVAEIHAFVKSLESMPLSRDIPMDEGGRFLLAAWERYKGLAPSANPQLRFKPFVVGLAARMRRYDIHIPVFRWMEREGRLLQVKCPTLIFTGSKDLFFNRAALEAAKNEAKCQVAVINGGGAMVCFEKPREVAAALLKFLQD